MRSTLVAMLLSSIALSSVWAWTEAETNAVGQALAELIAISSGCDDIPLPPDDPSANEPLEEPYPSFASLFSEDLQIAPNWTSEDKRAAFYHYLDSITNMTAGGVFTGNVWHADSAFSFCRIKGDAAVLPHAIGVLVSTNMPAALEVEPCNIFSRFAVPTIQMNEIVETLVSSRDRLRGPYSRKNIYDSYCEKLGQAFDAGQTNIAMSGGAILYSYLSDHRGASSLDALLLKVYPTYQSSSNRLFVALRALATDPSDEWSNGRFANVTNQLLNAAQPLPIVDGL